jgi:pyruvate/2-oxoglutarate dehydrogenase complex dihydrolipoamide dehydrogenase (E3) component
MRGNQKVAIVERKFFGGTCVNTGCTPTKTMVASADAAHIARRAQDFGVAIDGAVTTKHERSSQPWNGKGRK